MPAQRSDFTPLVDLLAARGTGPARSQRPLYVDLLPPCNHACPAGENIQGWLEHARSGRWHEAWLTLVRDNPLPIDAPPSGGRRPGNPAVCTRHAGPCH
jgi:NADPH-dependent glutamate synthase beta subunit-like oxidoreductase